MGSTRKGPTINNTWNPLCKMARRARSAERPGNPDEILYRLTEVLQNALTNPLPPMRVEREKFQPPSFDGTGDVNFFIHQFEDVAAANEWGGGPARIHLRAALKDSATACGQAETVEGIMTALRARFGMTSREAKAKLATLRRDSKTTLQEHAERVEKLVGIAYAEFPRQHIDAMKLDMFHTTLGHPYLQRHLLAVQAPTLEAAIHAGNEFLQIKTYTEGGSSIRQVEEEEAEKADSARAISSPLDTLLLAMSKLTEEVQAPKTTQRNQPAPVTERRPVRCFGCNKEGHVRRQCPTKPQRTSAPSQRRQTGNEYGPQQ